MTEFNMADFDMKSEKKEIKGKKTNKLVKVLKAIFINNIGYKILAVVVAISLWIVLLI